MIHINNDGHRGKYNNAATGVFIPQNPHKYKGTEAPVYKSALELRFMMYADRNPNVLEWKYEGTTIKYFDRLRNRVRRYFIDFTLVVKAGPVTKTIWIEVKPDCETHAPKGRSKHDQKSMATWMTNQCKWEAAEKMAKSKGYEFHLITEKHLTAG